jgi:hypothetical protein
LRAQLAAEEVAGARLPQAITGYARHGLNQAISREGVGVSTRAILDAFKNPEAPRVPIIQHPDVRRMLLWMKANTESLRAIAYYCAYCFDRARIAGDDEERDKWVGLAEVLTPILKAYGSDIGFRITELAVQVYGGYGYCSEYPVEQFMRDEKIASLYEGANGIQALDLVGRKLGMKKGAYFMSLLGEMNATIAKYGENPALKELAEGVQTAVNSLAEIGMFFATCGKEGKFLVPVANAYPFLMMKGKALSGWFLLWEAGVAAERLGDLAEGSKDHAFYTGKIAAAKRFAPRQESSCAGRRR